MSTKISIGTDRRNKKKQWVCRWSGDYDSDTGKSTRYAKSFKLKVEAEAFAAKKTIDFSQGGRRDEPKIVLKLFFDKWIRLNNSQRPGTKKLYSYTIDRAIKYFGPGCLLQRITADQAELFIAELKPLKGGDLSAWTIQGTLRNCKAVFESAVRWGYIPFNPFKHIKGPKARVTPWHYITACEYKRLLEAAPNPRRKAFYSLCYTGGLRFSEAVSLRWTDINLSGEIVLRNRPGTDEPEFLIKDFEERTVPLPKATIDILEDLKTYTEVTDEDSPYIVLSQDQHKKTIVRWKKNRHNWRWQDAIYNTGLDFKRHLRKAGIEAEPGNTLSIHTLRKSAIQNWSNALPMNVTKELAGHSNIATTQKYYCQVDPYHRAKAAEIIDGLLKQSYTENFV